MIDFDEINHVYKRDGRVFPSVTQILKGVGLIDESKWCTQWHLDRGTAIHKCCQFDCLGTLDEESIDPEIKMYVKAWRKFKTDNNFELEFNEEIVVHDNYEYAGTLDRTGIINNQRVIIDIKTNAIPKWCSLQLAAYQMALGQYLYERIGVALKANGTYSITPFNDMEDENVFIAAISLFKWKQAQGADV